jgi:aryl-alcohol dehydrogenase-like predicted oxidoreductase
VEQRALGRSGLKISRLGLGTMTWASSTDPDEAAAILVAFHDAGGTFVDTAASYSGGAAERILGALIADVVPRSELIIASKAGLSRYGDERIVDTSRRALLNQLDESLSNLGVDHLDLAPACAELGLGLLAYSPLGGGVLTGKYRSGVPADSRGAAQGRNLSSYSDARQVGIVEAVATAADGLATSPITVALSWLRNRPGVAAPIVGARTLGQLTAALQSLAVELPLEIQLALDDVSMPYLGYPEDVR